MFGPDYFITRAILASPEDRVRVEMFAGEEGHLVDGYDEHRGGHVLTFRDRMGWPIRQRLTAAGVRTDVTVVLS